MSLLGQPTKRILTLDLRRFEEQRCSDLVI